MAERIPASTTIRVPLQAYLSSDHVTAATGKTIAITISKNGAAYGNPSAGATNATEIASGSYYVDLSTTDTGTNGPLFILGTATATDNVVAIYDVVKATNAGFTGIADAVAGASGGLLISGSNSGTTTFGAVTCTGSFTISDGLLVNRSTSNAAAIVATGSGTGNGIVGQAGSTATNTSGGIAAFGANTSYGFLIQGGSTGGVGAGIFGGTTNKDAIKIVADGTGIGINFANNSGSTTNISCPNGITSNITGNLSGSVGSVTGAVGSVTSGVTVTTNNDKTGYTASTVSDKTGYTLTNAGYAAVMTQQLTESYAAKGTVPTPAQLMLEVRSLLAENGVSGTTVTTKKIDGSTSAATYTLNSATTPTSITRAT